MRTWRWHSNVLFALLVAAGLRVAAERGQSGLDVPWANSGRGGDGR